MTLARVNNSPTSSREEHLIDWSFSDSLSWVDYEAQFDWGRIAPSRGRWLPREESAQYRSPRYPVWISSPTSIGSPSLTGWWLNGIVGIGPELEESTPLTAVEDFEFFRQDESGFSIRAAKHTRRVTLRVDSYVRREGVRRHRWWHRLLKP